MNTAPPLPRVCDRTILRKLEDDDLPFFQTYRADPEVARFQSWESLSDDEALSFIRGSNATDFPLIGGWYQIGIADRSTGRLIGDIGVHVDANGREAEIGVTLSRENQGRGLGGEAVRGAIRLVFERTRVGGIVGITDGRNLSSIRLLTRVGMDKVTSVDTVFRGERCTELMFSMDRHRWMSRNDEHASDRVRAGSGR